MKNGKFRVDYLFIPAASLFILFIIFGSFFDFNISNFLHSKSDRIPYFFAAFGDLPCNSLIMFFGGFLAGSGFKYYKKKTGNYILLALSLVCFGLSWYFQGKAIFNANGYNIPSLKWPVGMPLSFAILSPIYMLGCFSAVKNDNKNMWKVALALAITIGIGVGLTNLVKLIPHRPRYRFLITQDEVRFHNWWEIFSEYKNYIVGDVTAEEFKSWPSGHTSGGCAAFTMYFVAQMYGCKNRKINILFFYLGLLYALLLGFTRMRAGAHFMSDVGFGGLISTAIEYTGFKIIDKKIKY